MLKLADAMMHKQRIEPRNAETGTIETNKLKWSKMWHKHLSYQHQELVCPSYDAVCAEKNSRFWGLRLLLGPGTWHAKNKQLAAEK